MFTNQATWVASLAHLGRISEAQERLQEFLKYEPDYTLSKVQTIHRFVDDEEKSRFIDGLRKAGMPE